MVHACSVAGEYDIAGTRGNAGSHSILKSVLDSVVNHARQAAPRECCGILFAHQDDGAHRDHSCSRKIEVVSAAAIPNTESAINLFEMEPLALARAELEGATRGLAPVGYYHSHVCGPPHPSSIDRDRVLWPDLPPHYHLLVTPRGEWAFFDTHGGSWSSVSVKLI